MSGLVKGLFGKEEKREQTQTTAFRPPRNFSISGTPGLGSVAATTSGDFTDIGFVSPSIVNQLGDESLGITRGVVGDVQNDIQSLRDLENPFIRARVRPVEAQFERLADDTTRDFRRRNIFGSLLQGERSAQADTAGRAIGDATAIAQADVLNAVSGKQEQLRALAGDIRTEGQLRLAQSLAERGLGIDAIRAVIASSAGAASTTQSGTASDNDSSGFGNLLFGLGSTFLGI